MNKFIALFRPPASNCLALLSAQIPLSKYPATDSSMDSARDQAKLTDQTAGERARRATGTSCIEFDGASASRTPSRQGVSTLMRNRPSTTAATLDAAKSHHINTRSSRPALTISSHSSSHVRVRRMGLGFLASS
jgi:hypothetical protein